MGDVQVHSIDPCPEIEPDDGTGRNVITGKFIHKADGNLFNLYVEGEEETTGVTGNHPYWSVDRQEFVEASELKPGEQIDTLVGFKKIAKIIPRPRDELVYNLEVHREHVYRVDKAGTLRHSMCGTPFHYQWIKHSTFNQVKAQAGAVDLKKFQAALKKGKVGPFGQSGIKKLAKEHNGYQYELKIKGSAHRILGNVNDRGVLIFDKFIPGGLH